MANKVKEKDKEAENIKKDCIFFKTILDCSKGTYTDIIFFRKLLYRCGCTIMSSEYDDSYDQSISKMIYTRGVVSTIRNNFEEHPFKLDECIRFITSNLKNDKNTYIRMGIKRDDVRKDFSFLCEAISRQIKNFMEIPDYSVYDFVKDMYYELILNDDNKDLLSLRKRFFDDVDNFEKTNIKSYLKKLQKDHESVMVFYDSNRPRKFYDIYVCNNIQIRVRNNEENKEERRIIENLSVPKLTELESNFVFLEASGGVGKTMMMKNLALSACYNFKTHYLLPIFINLRDYEEEDFFCFSLNKINSILERPIDKETFKSFLISGQCLFLLDGLDEVQSDYLFKLDSTLKEFSMKYSKNYYIISSRPYQKNSFLNTFTTVYLQPLSQIQAKRLVEKITFDNYDEELANEFKKALDKKLFKSHKEFCENPLLLTIMYITFDRTGIPEKRHEFYERAYWALADKYDSSRGRKRGIFSTKLTPSRFLDYLTEFSFVTYHNMIFQFTEGDFINIFEDLKERKRNTLEQFAAKDFLKDMVEHICLFYKDGSFYKFVHRSFQEFFCAKYFSKQSASKFIDIGRYLDQRDKGTVINKIRENNKDKYVFFFNFEEHVYDMFYSMCPRNFEELILLPILKEMFCRELFNDTEEFLYFLSKAYGDIEFSNDDYPENTATPHPKSAILEKILEGFQFPDGVDPEEAFVISNTYPELADGKMGLEIDEELHCIANFERITPKNKSMLREAGTIYKFNGDMLRKNIKFYQKFINELKTTILYDFYKYTENIYLVLEERYKHKKGISLIDLLD